MKENYLVHLSQIGSTALNLIDFCVSHPMPDYSDHGLIAYYFKSFS